MNPAESVNPGHGTDAERLTAYHEAGHALMAHLCGQQITEVEIVGDADHTGSVHSLSFPPDSSSGDGPDAERDAIEQRLKCVLAGTVAEAMTSGRMHWDDTSEDLDLAVRLAMPLVEDCEMVLPFLNEIRSRIESDLRDHWGVVEAIASELLEQKSLPGAEVRRIIENAG